MVELGCQSAIFDVLLGKLFFHGRVATFTRRLQTVSRDGYFWLYLLCHGLYLLCHGASVLWSSLKHCQMLWSPLAIGNRITLNIILVLWKESFPLVVVRGLNLGGPLRPLKPRSRVT